MKKHSFLIILIAIVAFVSCDGRDRIHKSPIEVLKENKLPDSFSEKITYYPKEYTETVTDTILSNGFRVKIKNYTNMNKSFIETIVTNSITHKIHHRLIKSDLSIYKDDTIIFQNTLDKNILLDNTPAQNLEQAKEWIFKGFWLSDNLENTINHELTIVGLISESTQEPNTDSYYEYQLIIDSNGNYKIIFE